MGGLTTKKIPSIFILTFNMLSDGATPYSMKESTSRRDIGSHGINCTGSFDVKLHVLWGLFRPQISQ